VRASLELADQLMAASLAPLVLWLATGSCATQAGLVAGAAWLRAPYEVVGVTVSRSVGECLARVTSLAGGATDLLELPHVDAPAVTVLDGYLGPGYGERSREGEYAARLVARTEGVFLDPVFAAKAMAALIGAARAGWITGPVVFLVTGGAPTLFTAPKGPT
jgi:D-cysteine desulfhydrase